MADNICCDEAKTEMEKHFSVVAREISHHWKDLGRKLSIGNAAIENIDADYPHREEKAFQLLIKWFGKNGRNGATKEELCKALHEIERTDIAEMICCSDRENHKEKKEKRPKSLILHRCSSVVILKRKSSSVGAVSETARLVSDLRLKTQSKTQSTHQPNDTKTEDEGLILRCPSCKSCLNLEVKGIIVEEKNSASDYSERRCAMFKNEIADVVLKIRNKKLHADNPVTEEGDAKTEDEEPELVLHCPSCPCGNCLNLKVEMHFGEN